jgi:dienelactone hydrolase
MVRLLDTEHLSDQLSAADWLQRQTFIAKHRIAVAGNSFGGIEAVLGAERTSYCAALMRRAVPTAGHPHLNCEFGWRVPFVIPTRQSSFPGRE